MNILPKVAIVEFNLSVKDFLEEWVDLEEEGEPTQQDYDNHLEAKNEGVFAEGGGLCEGNFETKGESNQ